MESDDPDRIAVLAWDPTLRSAAASSLPNDNEPRKWSELTWKERHSLLRASNPDAPSSEELIRMQKASKEQVEAKAMAQRELAAEADRKIAENTRNWNTPEAWAARCAREAEALLAATKSGKYPGNPKSGQRDDALYNLTRSAACLLRPAEHWDCTTGGSHPMRQDVSRYIFKHEAFGEGYVIEVVSHGQQETYYGGQGGGETKSRLLLESEVAQLESIGSLVRRYFGHGD